MTNLDRTQLLAHYIIYRSQPEKLGATKLNKVMWFCDLEAFQNSGKTISGQSSYKKKQFGPVPNGINRCLRTLQENGSIIKRMSPTPTGNRHEFIWVHEPDIASFTAAEVDIINRTIDWVCDNYTAYTVSRKTHDALWEETDNDQQIEVQAGIVVAKSVTGRYLEWALDQHDGQT